MVGKGEGEELKKLKELNKLKELKPIGDEE